MPDAPSPFDDPFADLFGKLPDPRERRSSGDDTARGTAAPVTPPSTGTQGPAPCHAVRPAKPLPERQRHGRRRGRTRRELRPRRRRLHRCPLRPHP